jgi:L-2-hydroxyglutarate oxidase LhgO
MSGTQRKNVLVTREQSEWLDKHPERNLSGVVRKALDKEMGLIKCKVCGEITDIKEGICKACQQSIALFIKESHPKGDFSIAVSEISGLYMKALQNRIGDKLYKTKIPAMIQLMDKHLTKMFSELQELWDAKE